MTKYRYKALLIRKSFNKNIWASSYECHHTANSCAEGHSNQKTFKVEYIFILSNLSKLIIPDLRCSWSTGFVSEVFNTAFEES
jgi:hypothetical protein